MLKIQVHGSFDAVALRRPPVEAPFAKELGARIEHAVRVSRSRGSEAPAILLPDIAEDRVVEIELEEGLRLWVRASELAAELGVAPERGASGDVVVIPQSLGAGGSRGMAGWLIRGLRVIGLDPVQATAKALAGKLEKLAVPEPGLFRWLEDGALAPLPPAGITDATAPLLLFLHGTASSTEGSFGDLRQNRSSEWPDLQAAYRNRVFALQHHTLSVSPIDNAIAVLKQLPVNARLHLVSHSRGGLIGELLSRAHLEGRPEPFTAEEIALLPDAGQSARLAELRDLLAEKRPKVERFVRVACPARGTILASQRLDRYLTVLANLLGMIPALAASELYDLVKSFTLAVVKERTRPESLPGLEAMMPESPFQKLLNRQDLVADADLSVIKGDLEGGGPLTRLLAFATDLFYREDHDLVVNTGAMDGGMPRKGGIRVHFVQGPHTNHFSYFGKHGPVDRLKAGLLRKDNDSAGFTPMPSLDAAKAPERSARGGTRPTVFVLPGIGGSLLRDAGRRVWVDLPVLAFGGLERIAIDKPDVRPDGLIDRYYGDLLQYLAGSHDVIPFPYDWRRSVLEEGRRLALALEQELDASGQQPVHIVAHSMGGLVVRAALAQRAGLWQRLRDRKDSRIVMLGTPNRGSYAIPMLLLGREQTMRMLAALDFTMDSREHLALVRRFPGVLEMLPGDSAFPLFAPEGWQALRNADPNPDRWPEPEEEDLDRARDARVRIEQTPIDAERMFYIAGQAPTVDGIRIGPEGIEFTRTHAGDGRVTYASGIPDGMRAWYTDAAHGDLARHKPVFPAIADLLRTGTTALLPTTPPPLRSATPPPPITAEPMEAFPTDADLAAAVLGGRARPPATRQRIPPVRVRVVHGTLGFARAPVLVGHYAGDSLAGAQAQLDRILDGRLRERRRLGLYPGAIGTSAVVLDPDCDPPRGAIVVGLGDAGRLTVGELEQTLLRGLLDYAASRRDEILRLGTAGAITVSSLLVGSGEAGLPVADCVAALLRALRRAQAALGADGRFTELELLELYEDRAIQAWREVQKAATSDTDGFVQPTGPLESGEGGRRQVAVRNDTTWSQPIHITMDHSREGEPRMTFVVPTGLARAEAGVLPVQKTFIDGLIVQAIATMMPGTPEASPGRALFELLVPEALKDRSRDDRPLRLILDEACAAYPWELLDDRRPWQLQLGGVQEKPLALRTGVVRQLVRHNYRQVPLRSQPKGPALVIGNPRAEAMGTYDTLPGAEAEAGAVARLLDARGFEVTLLTGPDASATAVLQQLCARAWRIVHIAGHGVVRDEPDGPGIVLGQDLILNAAMLRQLLPVPPELAFINCCHLGAIEPKDPARNRPGSFAAGIATQLIEMGVGAVIAAGWAVDDRAAQVFAESFYTAALASNILRETIKTARDDAYTAQPTSTTWGAYQCYGEPDWRLVPDGEGKRSSAPAYASVAEAINAADWIRLDAQTGTLRDTHDDLEALEALEEVCSYNGWTRDAALLASIGAAYAEIGEIDLAVQRYRSALECEPASLTLQVLEQLVIVSVRAAVHQAQGGGAGRRHALGLAAAAHADLQRIIRLAGSSVERHCLTGSYHKRAAQLSPDSQERSDHLSRMVSAYRQANAAASQPDPYPLMMLAAARIAAAWRLPGPPDTAALEAAVDEAERAAAKRNRDRPSFWGAQHRADAKLLRALAKGDLPPDLIEQVLGAYLDSWVRGGSRLRFGSVLGQLEFLVEVWTDGDPAHDEQRRRMSEQLVILRDKLTERVLRRRQHS